ncbi:hypothetical protein [Streptomyces sp. NPDC047043]|uniref:hypothetical protein n=1 Tax=Streptomyces sp. NPDC047043 TaxID=3154497 RepID=UPI0033D0D968
MRLSSHLVQRMLRLPPPPTRNLTVERRLRVPLRDGAVLLADRRSRHPAVTACRPRSSASRTAGRD